MLSLCPREAGEARCLSLVTVARSQTKGQMAFNLETNGGDGNRRKVKSTFQVAEVNRTLMSVSRICDQGIARSFSKSEAYVLNQQGEEVCKLERNGGMYVNAVTFKPLGSKEPFGRQAR